MLDINKKDIMFTGIQPTGNLTLGNYCGTMSSWKKMQEQYLCFFCIADLHALTDTAKKNKKNISYNNILDMVALYLSCGVNPQNSVVFLQSQVHTHSQLYWILSNFSYFGELSRMTQFKKRVFFNANKVSLSLFSYPVLMAADILLYKANYVSSGLDQKQHLELVQKIARRFNFIYGNIFIVPNILIKRVGYKIMALREPQRKMSKSDLDQNNVIFLLDDLDIIRDKISKAITDSDNPAQIIYNMNKKPGISNLLSILSSITEKNISQLEKEFEDYSYSLFKRNISDCVCDVISEIQRSYFRFRKDQDYLIDVLNFGKDIAISCSEKNFDVICKALGK
ncbi:tryptophan--tRNA ligase [Buchnera aphidicola]|uniref:Tryptophan--tRNA ligase n=1 Tax=Buchnera aphidicola (Cinara strobi) TaxID=1921549 RepID=A0A3B1E1B9_9GAMM|nr:tryptophan--tRNA ligase [Buchnera aphidicola]VAX76845.1 Tryptophan--tRNA ligase [Buchnera aphidicola (Cinara strobi)]